MIKLVKRVPTGEVCEYIVEHMRVADVREIKASEGNDVDIYNRICPHTYTNFRSDFYYTWHSPSNNPIAISGIVRLISSPKIGVPWLLGTDEIVKYPRQILVESRKILKKALESKFEYLYNYVHEDNELSKKYLKVIGFKIYEPEPMGPYGELFRKFDMGTKIELEKTVLAGGSLECVHQG